MSEVDCAVVPSKTVALEESFDSVFVNSFRAFFIFCVDEASIGYLVIYGSDSNSILSNLREGSVWTVEHDSAQIEGH